jgi:hypothetical protein
MEETQDTIWQTAIFRVLVAGCSKTSPKDAFSRSGALNIFWRLRSAIAGAIVFLSPSNRPTAQASFRQALLFFIPQAYIHTHMHIYKGQNRAVGIAAPYGLDTRGSNSGGGEIFCTRPDWPWGPPSLLIQWVPGFPGGKAARAWR